MNEGFSCESSNVAVSVVFEASVSSEDPFRKNGFVQPQKAPTKTNETTSVSCTIMFAATQEAFEFLALSHTILETLNVSPSKSVEQVVHRALPSSPPGDRDDFLTRGGERWRRAVSRGDLESK